MPLGRYTQTARYRNAIGVFLGGSQNNRPPDFWLYTHRKAGRRPKRAMKVKAEMAKMASAIVRRDPIVLHSFSNNLRRIGLNTIHISYTSNVSSPHIPSTLTGWNVEVGKLSAFIHAAIARKPRDPVCALRRATSTRHWQFFIKIMTQFFWSSAWSI